MASQKIRGITIELNADTAGILDGIKELNKSLSSTDKALRDVDKLLKFDPGNTTLVAQQQEYLAKAIDETKLKLEEEKKLLETMKGADNASETVEQQKALAREIEDTTQKLNKYESRLKQTDTSLDEVKDSTEQAKSSTLSFGNILKANLTSEAIIQGVRMLADGIKDIATSALEVGSAFESSMSQVAATMGMTSADVQNNVAEYKLLADTAKEMGKATMFSASEAADALNYLALAGYDAEKAAKTLPQVLTLAAAGDMELAYASDLVTDAMSALGMSTEDVQKYIDQMAKTSQKANTNVSQLGEATLVVAGTVALTGQSLETMNTELGILADNGLKGAEGGTHLRNILLSLSAPTDKAAQKIEELGLVISDSDGNMRDLNDIMIDLNASLGELGSVEKTAAIKSIFNKTDIGAVNALLKDSGERFTELNSQISTANGAAQAMADTMINNLKGKVTILQSALEGLGISFFEVFDDDAKVAVDSATSAVGELQKALETGDLGKSVRELSDSFGDLMLKFVDFAADALPDVIDGATWFIDHLDEITTLIAGLTTGYIAYEAATTIATIATEGFTVALEANPIGLVAGALAGMIALMVSYSSSVSDVTSQTKDFNESLRRISETKVDYSRNISDVESLAKRIERLNSVTDLSADQQYELASAVKEWNSLVGESNQLILDNTGHVEGNTEALAQNLEVAEAQYRLAQKQEELNEILEKRAELEDLIADAEERKLELNEALTESDNMSAEAARHYNNELITLDETIAEANAQIEEYGNQYTILCDEVNNASDAQQDFTTAQQEEIATAEQTEEALAGIADICEELGLDYVDLKDKAIDSLEGQREEFEKMGEAASKSVDEIGESFEKQAENMTRWAEDIAKAQEIMGQAPEAQGLLDYYISQGPAAAGEVENLIEAFYAGGDALEDFKEACIAFNETEDLIEQLSELNVAIETGSTEAIQLAIEQLDTDLPEMEDRFRTSWETQELDAETHRVNMTDTATGTVTDMATSIDTNAQLVQDATKRMMDNSLKAAYIAIGMDPENPDSRAEKFYLLGMKIDQSIADGISENEGLIASALQSAFDNALSSVSVEGIGSKVNQILGQAFGG